jgi:hypothetical protein
MAYVPGFLHDIFISYACADDRQDGLIRRFWTLLTDAIAAEGLKIKEEGGSEGVEVFLDNRTLESGSDLTEQVLTSARSTAVFIALHSPAYLKSSWCQREAEEFTANYDPTRPKLQGRLFVASIGKRGGPEESPIIALRSRRFRRFFYVHEDGKDFPFDPNSEQQKNPDGYTFKEEARMLAREMVQTLEAMRKESPAPRIFLAETSPQRQAQAEDIKRWLLQKQVIVLRVSGLGDGWEKQSRDLIGQADLFVDLHESKPTAAAVEQARIATELCKSRVRWLCRGELTPDAAQVMMQETRVIEETLEDFKMSLESLLVRPGPRHKPATPALEGKIEAPGTDAFVLLVGARKDQSCLVAVEKKLDELGCGRDALMTEDVIETPDLWRAEFQKLLTLHGPGSVVFVDGECAGPWRDIRLRDLLLLLEEAAPLAKPALCVFPPPEKPDRRLKPRRSQIAYIDYQQLDELSKLLGGA